MTATIAQAQQAYKAQQAQGRTPEMTEAARTADKASHKELNAMRAQPCNAECFDCTAKKPGWAALPHGVFVCIDCAQIHRLMGRHVTQTKAVNTGTYLWFPHELAVMRAVGNGVAARAYSAAPPKPDRDAPQAEKEAYCRSKYIDCSWGPTYDAAVRQTALAAARAAPPPPQTAARPFAQPPAKPLQPVAAAVVQSAVRQPATAGRKGGLAATKVMPAVDDALSLIDFGAAATPPATPATPPQQAPWTASFDDDDWRSTPAAAPAVDEYLFKKAAVLSMYGAGPQLLTPPRMCWGSHVSVAGNSSFFAQYGL